MKNEALAKQAQAALQNQANEEPNQNHVRPVGIVHLGRAAGKVKFAIVDEDDVQLVQEYHLEARLCIDRNGNGAAIFAYAVPLQVGSYRAIPLQNLVWERRCAGVASDKEIGFRNGVALDCRIENLHIVGKQGGFDSRVKGCAPVSRRAARVAGASSSSSDLYSMAIRQLAKTLPATAIEEPYAWYGKVCDERGIPFSELGAPYIPSLLLANGSTIASAATGSVVSPTWNWVLEDSRLYECHNPPCTMLEQAVHQFSVCGRCHCTRYCCVTCQQEDWARHKQLCRPPLSHLGSSSTSSSSSTSGNFTQRWVPQNQQNHVNVIDVGVDH